MATATEPSLLLIDTHIWLWLMRGDAGLSPASRLLIDDAMREGRLRLSMISIWEVAMLASRNRIRLGKPVEAWIADALAAPAPAIQPLSSEIALASCYLPDGFRSDPADEIIVATARVIGATLMTHDRSILAYAATGNLSALAA